MPFDVLIALSDEAAALCNDLFDLLLDIHDQKLIDRVCRACDQANMRLWRRQKEAGLLPRSM